MSTDDFKSLAAKFLILHKENLISVYIENADIKKNIHVFIKESHEINASASTNDDHDLIVVNSGLIDELLNHISSICLIDIEKKSNKVSLPKDYYMETAALMLFLTTFFIVSHEFFHIYYGHCDYLRTIIKLSKIDLYGKNLMPISSLDYQTLEMCADTGAICVFAEQVKKLVNDNNNLILYGSHNMIFSYCLAAFNLVFYTLRKHDKNVMNTNIKSRSHPPIFLRQIMCLFTFEKYLNVNYVDSPKEEAEMFLFGSLLETEQLLRQKTGFGFSYTEFKSNMLQLAIEHEKALRNNWKNSIEKKILPYTRICLPYMESV